MNSWPGLMARLSMLTPSKQASADTRRAFSAAVSSLSFRALSMSHLPGREGMIGLDQIRKGMTLAIDFLIVLVTFAGQDNHVICRGAGNQLRNRLTTASNEGNVIHSTETGTDVVENDRRIFSARVVVGDEYAIGQALNHFCHQRALAAIAITAAAAQALHATGGAFEFRQDFKNLVQRVVQSEQGTDSRQYVAQVETTQQGAT